MSILMKDYWISIYSSFKLKVGFEIVMRKNIMLQ